MAKIKHLETQVTNKNELRTDAIQECLPPFSLEFFAGSCPM
jgi:hypothetical protein